MEALHCIEITPPSPVRPPPTLTMLLPPPPKGHDPKILMSAEV